MGDRVEPTAAPTAGASQAQRPQAGSSQDMQFVTNYLLDNWRIAERKDKAEKHRRYAHLNATNMFASLVPIYEAMFRIHWPIYKRTMEQFPPPTGVTPQAYTARIYLSVWFHDLYHSIRESVRRISPAAFIEKFEHERLAYSSEYDVFLANLMAQLRPTNLAHKAESTLYIPLLTKEDPTWTDEENPFGITNADIKPNAFYSILQCMKDRNTWKIITVPDGTTGRPFWLFDWHDDKCTYAWFPKDANYNDFDVALAFIVGVACTPKLGERDTDSWQFAGGDPYPTGSALKALQRVDHRIFFGSTEVRTIETDDFWIPPNPILSVIQKDILTPAKRKFKSSTNSGALSITETSSSAMQITGPSDVTEISIPNFRRYRIIDWCYHSRIIENCDTQTRTAMLRKLVLN